MNDIELFEQARRRVQGKMKERWVTNKEVIIDQEKEIMYYRNKIRQLQEGNKRDKTKFNKVISIEIDSEEYRIEYRDKTDTILLNACLIRLINEKDKIFIAKDEEFKIINITRYNKSNYKKEQEELKNWFKCYDD